MHVRTAAVEVLENLAHVACASNLVRYLLGFMHFTPALASITVTNFMGTGFFLALLGGFLSDAFFTSYTVYILSATVQLLVRTTQHTQGPVRTYVMKHACMTPIIKTTARCICHLYIHIYIY